MAQFAPIGHVRNDRTTMSAGHWADVESRIELVIRCMPGASPA